jgi:hypothetical protein
MERKSHPLSITQVERSMLIKRSSEITDNFNSITSDAGDTFNSLTSAGGSFASSAASEASAQASDATEDAAPAVTAMPIAGLLMAGAGVVALL